MSKLPLKYYQNQDVLFLSRDLLGKSLMTSIDGEITGGLIVETEAYRAPEDRASHAYGYRRTERNEAMYQKGGVCYVFTCYGIHSLFNVVTNKVDVPHAILIRAIAPTIGIDVMLKRRKRKKIDRALTTGPGTVSQALGIARQHNGLSLKGDCIWIEDLGISPRPEEVITGPRVGIDYAGEDAKLPWRFIYKSSTV